MAMSRERNAYSTSLPPILKDTATSISRNSLHGSGPEPARPVAACRGRQLDLGFVANHFDVVPVRTNDKSRIVVLVVVGPQTGRPIVLTPSLQRRAVESFDLMAILGGEGQVKMR